MGWACALNLTRALRPDAVTPRDEPFGGSALRKTRAVSRFHDAGRGAGPRRWTKDTTARAFATAE